MQATSEDFKVTVFVKRGVASLVVVADFSPCVLSAPAPAPAHMVLTLSLVGRR